MNAVPSRADVVVIGLGAAGSAALRFLASAGAKVVGIDRFSPPHDMGSSHGETRMLRTAYSEGAAYVPMVLRSIALWRALEQRRGESLLHQTGVVYGGPGGDPFLAAAKQAAREHKVELVEEEQATESALAVPAGWQRLIDVQGGYLDAEACIEAFLADAVSFGATLVTGCRCNGFVRAPDGVVIETEQGAIRADKAVVTTGAWSATLMRRLARVTHVERRVLHWFKDMQGACRRENGFRPFLIATEDDAGFYGFPANANGEVKVAEHFKVETIPSPDAVDRTVSERDHALIRPLVARFLPGLGEPVRSAVCLYPMSRDEHFIIDRLPGTDTVTFAAGLSGHGFKFAPVIGEALANLVLDQPQEIDVGFFSLKRFPEFR